MTEQQEKGSHMRNLLLSSVGVLVLAAGPALAWTPSVDVSVPVKNAAASDGSNAATTGGTAGSFDGNSLSSTSSKSYSSSASNSFNKTFTTTVGIDKNLSATSGGSGGSASATTGGVAVNKPDSGNKALALLGGTAVSDGNLSQSISKTSVDVTMATADSNATVSDNSVSSGRMHDAKIIGSNVSMTYSMGGMGILTAQQNTGAAASQQNSVALSSIVIGSGSPGSLWH